MSLKNITVEGCTLEFQNGGNNESISITSGQTSQTVKADGKPVYKTLKFTVSGYTASAEQSPTWIAESGTGQGEITASAEHVKVDGNAVILEGDTSAEITINGQKQQGQSVVPDQVTEVVKVTKAGQDKAKGA